MWQYEAEEGTHDMFMDINEEIRFRVVDEVFTDTTPVGPEDGLEAGADENETKKSPYSLVVSTRQEQKMSSIILLTSEFSHSLIP